MRTGEQAAIAKDVIDFMDALKIPKAIIAGYDRVEGPLVLFRHYGQKEF